MQRSDVRGQPGEQGKGRWLRSQQLTASGVSSRPIVHRPFSLLTQLCLLLALIHYWRANHCFLLWLNVIAWAGILADAGLHVLRVRQ